MTNSKDDFKNRDNVVRNGSTITIKPRKKRIKKETEVLDLDNTKEVVEELPKQEVETLQPEVLEEVETLEDVEVLDTPETLDVNTEVEELVIDNSLSGNEKETNLQPIEEPVETKKEEVLEIDDEPKPKKKMAKKFMIPLIIIGIILGILIIISAILTVRKNQMVNNNKVDEVTNTVFFLANEKGKYGLFDDNGNKITDFIYTDYSDFVNGSAIVYKNKEVGIINENGDVTLDYGKYKEIENVASVYKVHNDKYEYSLVDSHGKLLYDLKDKDVTSFTDEKNYYILKDKKEYQIMNNKNKAILKLKVQEGIEPTINIKDDYAEVFYNNKNYILNKNKKITEFDNDKNYCVNSYSKDNKIIVVSSCVADEDNSNYMVIVSGELHDLSDKCSMVEYTNNNIICTDKNGRHLLDGEYNIGIKIDNATYIDNTNYATNNKNSSVEIFNEGNSVSKVSCRSVNQNEYNFSSNYVLSIKKSKGCPKEEGNFEIYKSDGTKLVDKQFTIAKKFDENKNISVSEDGSKYYLINESGEKISEDYDVIFYTNGNYIVTSGGKKGILDKTGKEVVECNYVYIEVKEIQNKYIAILKESNGKYTIYDMDNNKEIVIVNSEPKITDHYIEVDNSESIYYYTLSGKKFLEIDI